MEELNYVAVKNLHKFEIVDHFLGEEFRFPPGKVVRIPAEVAKHIFGWGLPPDQRNAQIARHGFSVGGKYPAISDPEGFLSKILIKPVKVKIEFEEKPEAEFEYEAKPEE